MKDRLKLAAVIFAGQIGICMIGLGIALIGLRHNWFFLVVGSAGMMWSSWLLAKK